MLANSNVTYTEPLSDASTLALNYRAQLDRNLSANLFNEWWNNGNKPELEVQDSPVSNTNTIDHQPTKDLFDFNLPTE